MKSAILFFAKCTLWAISFSLLSSNAEAYADFIGYGYRNCQVCHVSSAGGGMLTDYGRAVFATEIAGRVPWITADEETLGQYSNFLGKKQFPWWMRLGLKYRSLTTVRSPGSSQSASRYYNMQNDLNVAFFLDKKQTYSLVGTFGYTESARAIDPNTLWSSDQYLFSREYYVKYRHSKEYSVYLGMFDKTFGIRNPDHTANNRAPIGLGQNDQVHGLMLHRAQSSSDTFLHLWAGNLQAHGDRQKPGGSIMYEYDLGDMLAVGGEVLHEGNSDVKSTIVAAHAKKGFGSGSSFLGELGYVTSETIETRSSIYAWTQGHLKITRGLFFESTGEYTKQDVESLQENLRWTLGFLWFPIQRVELRAAIRQTKILNTPTVEKDQWYYLTQLHLSL